MCPLPIVRIKFQHCSQLPREYCEEHDVHSAGNCICIFTKLKETLESQEQMEGRAKLQTLCKTRWGARFDVLEISDLHVHTVIWR